MLAANITLVLLFLMCLKSGLAKKRMYGSEDANDGQFPYAAFHIMRTTRGFSTCSGSLLTDRWVLLAAHCVNRDASNPQNHLVVAGKADLNQYLSRRFRTRFQTNLNGAQFDLQERRAAAVYYHPRYSRYGNNDIGLIHVDRPFQLNSRVDVINLTREPMGVERMCTIVGYGMVENNRHKHVQQFIRNMPARPAPLCRYERNKDVICLADRSRGICHGDSGGPIVCDGLQRGVAAYGLTSGGSGCGIGTVEQYYADAQLNRVWVDAVMSGNSTIIANPPRNRYNNNKGKSKKKRPKLSRRFEENEVDTGLNNEKLEYNSAETHRSTVPGDVATDIDNSPSAEF